MSEFNTGKPPAGEAGMCVLLSDESARREYFRRWDGKTFYCGRYCDHQDSARLAFRDPIAIDLGVVYWRFATIADLTASGIPESEARGMVHRSQLPDAPWYPPQQDGFGPWVEHKPGDPMPIGGEVLVHCLQHNEREARAFSPQEFLAAAWDVCFASRTLEARVVAYCVRLEVDNASAEPTTAEVEATQNPAVMAADQNEAMKNRDALKRTINTATPKDEGWREYDPKYPPIQPYRMDFKTVVEGVNVRHFYRRADTSAVDVVLYARNGLILVAQWTNRLGGNWGSFE